LKLIKKKLIVPFGVGGKRKRKNREGVVGSELRPKASNALKGGKESAEGRVPSRYSGLSIRTKQSKKLGKIKQKGVAREGVWK